MHNIEQFFYQIIVISLGDIVEACEPPPPCLSAFCMCGGGGFEGATNQRHYCDYFFKPCDNGNEICNECFYQSGCLIGRKTPGSRVAMSCERKDAKSPIICNMENQKKKDLPHMTSAWFLIWFNFSAKIMQTPLQSFYLPVRLLFVDLICERVCWSLR